jgi:uridine phosphorylase
MPFPLHPRKHREEPLFTASDFHKYEASRTGSPPPKPPSNLVLVFGSRWREYLTKRYGNKRDPRSGVYRLNRTVGIAHVSGPGAPFAAIVVEELAALGVQQFLIVGLAGSLQANLPVGSLVVCTRALRDEGTSYHYAPRSSFARPSPRLVAALKATLERNRVSFTEGPSWTTDAPYRETIAELRRYRRSGIVTVEMEASAIFTVARCLGGRAAALFVISDHLDERGWEPRFHDSTQALRRALRLALQTFAARPRRA